MSAFRLSVIINKNRYNGKSKNDKYHDKPTAKVNKGNCRQRHQTRLENSSKATCGWFKQHLAAELVCGLYGLRYSHDFECSLE